MTRKFPHFFGHKSERFYLYNIRMSSLKFFIFDLNSEPFSLVSQSGFQKIMKTRVNL